MLIKIPITLKMRLFPNWLRAICVINSLYMIQSRYDESPDGDLIQCDMTQILLNQEKYRRLLGDMNVQNILAQMHPTQSTAMDDMTDEQHFDCDFPSLSDYVGTTGCFTAAG